MKRSHSFEDTTVKLKAGYDDDGKLSGDYDHVNIINDHVDINCDRRLEKLQILNGKKKMASSVLDILESNNRIEQMEIENYTLRKRCKRLENIVTQLLENKGKNDDDDDDDVGDDLNGRHGQIFENNIHLLKTKYKEPCYLEVSQSPPYENSKSPQYANRSPLGDGESSPPQFLHTTHPSMIVTSSTSPAFSEPNSNHVPVSSAIKRENVSGDAVSRVDGIAISDPRHAPQDHSPKEKVEDKVKEEEEALENISPEEMEQRNEMFRATYYTQRSSSNGNSNSNSSNSNSVTIRRSSLTNEQRFPVEVKPKKHHSSHYSECASYERCRGYESKSRSPELAVSPYYSRYHDYDVIKVDHERKGGDGNQGPPRLIGGAFPRERSKSFGGEAVNYHSKVTTSQVIYPNDKNLSEPIRSKPFHNTHAQRHGEIKTFPVVGPQRPLASVMAADPDLNKYSSDFYRKLPPKLHIVESQNENGVTLTWNATSNCDSSLVKTYQLFARELFGHKVGTMKRIGTVDALPLPMSCNIDKLKYNIKYKFAVCAVDIYGRFGKMSNFTGKFELKPKGPISEVDEKEAEIEVIV